MTILKEVIAMKRSLVSVLCIAILLLISGSSVESMAPAAKETVTIAEKAGIGKYLVGSDGRALYYFKNDPPGGTTCYGECDTTWPNYCFSIKEIAVVEGLNINDFGEFTRKGGRSALTYKGVALYNYSGDREPGDTKGHGIDNLWFLVQP
jgi:predicted lipoprotein with Yx(FWY)xxD motif